jgi:hypothetical protein
MASVSVPTNINKQIFVVQHVEKIKIRRDVMLGSIGFGSIYEAGLGWVTLDRVKLRYSGPLYLNLSCFVLHKNAQTTV